MNLTGKRYGIIFFTLATALPHLSFYPYYAAQGRPFDPIVLNGLGYLALLAAYFLPIQFFQRSHRLVWWALFGYTVLTILLWIMLGDKQFVTGTSSAIGYYAKAVEIILLAFLWADKQQPASSATTYA